MFNLEHKIPAGRRPGLRRLAWCWPAPRQFALPWSAPAGAGRGAAAGPGRPGAGAVGPVGVSLPPHHAPTPLAPERARCRGAVPRTVARNPMYVGVACGCWAGAYLRNPLALLALVAFVSSRFQILPEERALAHRTLASHTASTCAWCGAGSEYHRRPCLPLHPRASCSCCPRCWVCCC